MENLYQPIEPAYLAYLRDESRRQGHAKAIAFPQNEEELLAALGGPEELTVQGARTGLDGLAVPDGGHIVNLSRFRAILSERIDGGKRILRCEAGCALNALEDERWFFPPAPTEASATLGGVIRCDAQGIYAAHYGGMGAYTANVERLPGTDIIASAEGTLLPIPNTVWAIGLFFESDEAARAFLYESLPAACVAAEYLDQGALSCIASMRGHTARLNALPQIPAKFCAMAYLELHADSEEAVQQTAGELLALADTYGADAAFSWALAGWAETRILRDFRHFAQEAVLMTIDAARAAAPSLHAVGAEAMLSAEALSRLRGALGALGIRYACFGHIHGGRTRVELLPTNETELRQAEAFLKERMS